MFSADKEAEISEAVLLFAIFMVLTTLVARHCIRFKDNAHVFCLVRNCYPSLAISAPLRRFGKVLSTWQLGK
jgi:hypothetical protein